MLDWLAGWLRNVIAVVLLAGLVELLLPGKAMQRYARLVIGLLVLLTLMSPLLKLFGADGSRLLEEGLRRWEATSSAGMPEMPGLEQIRRDADRMRLQQERQAGTLAAGRLASAMAAEAEAASGRAVAGVDIVFDDAEQGKIRSVDVRLLDGAARAGGRTGSAVKGSGADEHNGRDAEPVEPVDIGMVDVAAGGGDGGEAGGSAAVGASGAESGAWAPADPAVANAVRAAIAAKWGIAPEIIAVRLPARIQAGGTSG